VTGYAIAAGDGGAVAEAAGGVAGAADASGGGGGIGLSAAQAATDRERTTAEVRFTGGTITAI